MKKINEILRDLREKKEMSAEQVARMCQMSTQDYMWIEYAIPAPKKPTEEQLKKLADALNVPFPILLFLSLEEDDVIASKRELFKKSQSTMYAVIETTFLKD